MKIASRLDRIGLSAIRAMNMGAPAGSVSLGLGEPAWPLPAAVADRLENPYADRSYGPNAGIQELREAVAAFHGVSAERVMITAGSQGALFALFQAWSEPGSDVMVPDPGFLAYPALARLAGAEPAPYALGSGGSLDADAFIAALEGHPRASLAIVNHPGNPCGGGASAGELARVAEACMERAVTLISDEVYRELYLGDRTPSLLDVSDYGITLSSVSKAWASPGLRVGWAVGDPAILEPARLIHNYMTTAASRPSQAAAFALLSESASVVSASRAALRSRWAALSSALASELGIVAHAPAGAFYYWLPLPRGAEGDPLAFCLRVRDEGGVIVIPGLAFGERGRPFARLSYAGKPSEIREGVRRLAPFCKAV